MPAPRHARPPASRRPAPAAAAQGRHRAKRRAAPGRPAFLGIAVLAVGAAGGLGLHRLAVTDEPQAAAAGVVTMSAPAPASDGAAPAAERAAAERASRSQERARLQAAQKRAHERLTELRVREARLACARAEDVLAGLGLDEEQQRNLGIIIDTARRMDLPPRAAVIAVAAAWQESHLRNLDYGLADSVGMFQQRPSMGWGSNSRLQNPFFSTRRFYERLIEIPGWRRLPVGNAAQAVQASAHPAAYARWVDAAVDGVRAMETLRTARAHC